MARFSAVPLVMGLFACGRGSPKGADACLALPPAVRAQLTAGPDGTSLYWMERVQQYDFDAEQTGVWRLVRYDLRTRRSEVVFDDVSSQLRFIGGQLVVVRHTHSGMWSLVLLAADHHTQELTPGYLDVRDVEVLDGHTLVFLADGDGARAVYVLGLDELRPYPLVDADVLLSASGGRVFARADDQVLVVDVKTRKVTRIPDIKKSQPQGASLVHVDNQRVLVNDMLSHESQAVVTEPRPWRLVYQGESTLARTAPEDERSYAYVIDGDRATALPTVIGGASIVRTTQLGRQRWALVGHNTTNYAGDLGDTNAEADVCPLPAAKEVTYPTRQVPLRFADRAPALFAALAETSPDATLQVRDDPHEPPTVFIRLMKEFGGKDLAAMGKRARDLDERVTHLLRDREIRTDVMFADRRRAVYRWRRDRLRYRTTVGMGDALVTDPADFDFEVSGLENQKDDGKITCAGTLKNLTHRALTGVDIKCSGNRSHVIHVDELEVDEARAFSQTFEVSEDGEAAYLEVLVDGKPMETRDVDDDARSMSIFNLAADAYAASGLWLEDHEVGSDGIDVTLTADHDFLNRDAAAQETAIHTAYERYAGLRKIFGAEADATLRVHVDVQLSDATFDYDGARLVSDE